MKPLAQLKDGDTYEYKGVQWKVVEKENNAPVCGGCYGKKVDLFCTLDPFCPLPDNLVFKEIENVTFSTLTRNALAHAKEKHGDRFASRHEAMGVLFEEKHELWVNVMNDESDEKVLEELAQVSAMCFKFAELLGVESGLDNAE